MGLDTVELVVRFEDAFGIKIPDKVAAELTTPRQVTDYVLTQLKLVDRTACMSQQAFYRLRRAFVAIEAIERAQFRPDAKLSELVPVEKRQRIWNSVRSQIGAAALPDLVRPRWLFGVLTAGTFATAAAVFVYTAAVVGQINTAFVVSLLVGGVLGYLSERLTRPLRCEFHHDYAHAGDLAKYFAIQAPHLFKREWTREEVAQTVRAVIIDQTGVRDFSDDSRFVQDMHLD